MKLRIATFNMENLDESDRSPTLQERIPFLRPMLKRVNADVLCLQEVHGQERPDQKRALLALEEVIKDTKYADYFIEHTKTSHNEAYDKRNLVLISRFPIREVQQYRNTLVKAPKYERVTANPPDDEADDVRVERPILYTKIDIAPDILLHLINVHLKSRLPSSIPGQKKDRFAWKSSAGWAEGFFISSMKRVSQALEARILIDSIFEQDENARILVCGDFNASPGEVPVEAICGKVEDTGNADLVKRVLVPCEKTIPETSRFTFIHRGEKRLLDHILISLPMLSYYRHSEIHNENLHDESVAFATDNKFPESDHAPFVAEFEI